jgi:hypothetical protein
LSDDKGALMNRKIAIAAALAAVFAASLVSAVLARSNSGEQTANLAASRKGNLQVGVGGGTSNRLPCRRTPSAGLVAKVDGHVAGGRDRICQVGADTGFATITKRTADDSVAAVRHVLTLQQRRGEWRVMRDLHIQKCQPGRGHQSFARRPLCI